MSLRKATQAVIAPNICTTDTTQTISGAKTFSQPITGDLNGSAGSCTGNSNTASSLNPGKTIQIGGAVTGTATLFNGSTNITIPSTITSGAAIPSPNFTGTATGSLISKIIQGVTDGTSAAVGFMGEVIASTLASGSAVPLTSAAIVNVTSIPLTAGEWYVNAQVDYKAAGGTVSATILRQGISQTPATFGGQDTFSTLCGTTLDLVSTSDIGIPIKSQRIVITGAGTTPVYLVARATFTVGAGESLSAYGTIEARRIR